MLTKTCFNPSCKKDNPPDRIHCKFCGWKLPAFASDPAAAAPPQPPPATPPVTPPVQTQPSSQVVSPPRITTPTAPPQAAVPLRPDPVPIDPAPVHPVAADPVPVPIDPVPVDPELVAQHTALAEAHQQLQQEHATTLTEKRTLSARLTGLEQELMRIPGLEQALALARQEADKLRSQPPSVVIQKGAEQVSLLRKVITWAVPVVTAIGGLFAGVHTPLNTYKSQVDQTKVQLQQTMRELNVALAQGQKTQFAKQELEQQNGQLAGQLATESAQQLQANQSSSAQLATAQRDLQTTRASLAAVTTQLQQTQRERASADQRAAQLQAESSRNRSQLDAAQNVIAKHPLLNYRGPTEGNIVITYSARNDKAANITIDHQRISADGSLSVSTMAGSMLPGVPVVVQASGNKRASVVDAPSPANGWSRLTIRVEGKDQHQAMVHWSVPQ